MTEKKSFPPTGDEGTPTPDSLAEEASSEVPRRLDVFEEVNRALEAVQPRPTLVKLTAVDFTHIGCSHALGRELLNSFDHLDLSCPDLQALVVSVIGTFYGDILAERLAPVPFVAKVKPIRRNRPPRARFFYTEAYPEFLM